MTSSQEKIGSVEIVETMNAVEFDTDAELFRATYDSDRDPPSMAVVAVVAAAASSDPVELAPLHTIIDTGALDDLFSASTAGVQRRGSTSFRYEGFAVTVFSEGMIEVSPAEHT